MKKFEQLLSNYNTTKEKIQEKVNIADFDVKEVSRKLGASVSTTYSKLNGRDVLIHKDYLILADLIKIDKTPLIEYADFLTKVSNFIEENNLFKQAYFLGIISKDNVGIKKRFKNPLVWKPDEVKDILKQLKKDLKESPFEEIFID